MRNMLFCVAIASLCPGIGMSRSNDSEPLGFGMDVHGAVEVTYQSKYIWRGFDGYDDDPALQVAAGLTDIMGSGIGVGFAGHVATGIGHTNGERLDFTVYYADSIFSGETFAAAYRIGWVHYNYPGLYKKQKDLEEMHGMVSLPNLTGMKNLVPSYALVGMWPAFSGSSGVGSNASGFLHFLMLDYSFAVPGAFPDTPEQAFKLHSELVYNDGVSPFNADVDHSWSHAVIGASTDVDLGYGIVLVPSLNYQLSMERSVNPKNEAWATVGARYSF